MRSDWVFAKKVLLVTSITGFLAACSPARWHETQGQPGSPQPTFIPMPPVKPQEVPPVVASTSQPGTFLPPDRSKDCGHRFPGRDCEDNEEWIENEPAGEVAFDDMDESEPAEEVEYRPVATATPQPTPVPAPVPQKPVPTVANNNLEDCPPEEAQVPIVGKTKRGKASPAPKHNADAGAGAYFAVLNVATEKLRLYQKGRSGYPHKLILETDMAVGHNSPGNRTILGEFEVVEWIKFYEDPLRNYPSFYNPAYVAPPDVGAPLSAWLSKSLLPGGRGLVRGMFGWYTAVLGPNADHNGMHGTWGWGADGNRFISALRSGRYDDNLRVATRGGVRVENRAIALLRELLVPGAKVFSIYAREAYSRPEPEIRANGRVGTWPWALTADGINQVDGSRAGLNSIKARRVPRHMIIDEGVFEFDQTPTAVPLTNAKNPHASGNAYRLQKSSLKGVFLVDVGLTLNYVHPKELKVGGRKKALPGFFRAGNVKKVYQPSTRN